MSKTHGGNEQGPDHGAAADSYGRAPRSVVIHPHPMLRAKARPVAVFDAALAELAEDMIRLMYEEEGVGLAAPQVGVGVRLFVANARRTDDEPDRVYVNPALEIGGEPVFENEGCLSLPEIRGDVRRPLFARIRAQDVHGEWFELEDDEFLARVWQHENDHLDGVLIIDKMRPIDRIANRRLIRDLEARSS